MKKFLSVMLTLTLLLSLATLTTGAANTDVADTSATYYVSANEYETITTANAKVYGFIGDLDGDKEISIMDATSIQLYIAKLLSFDETSTLLADTDRDGDVSIIDATAIQCFIAKLESNAKVAHTLYEITASTNTGDVAQQVVNYLKANGNYDADLDWYTVRKYSDNFYVGLIYDATDNEIFISTDFYSETENGPIVSVFCAIPLEKEEYRYNTFLANRYENGESVYDAFGEAKQLKSTDKKLSLTSYIFESEVGLTFNDVESEIQEAITVGMASIEEILGDNVNGNLYSLFA